MNIISNKPKFIFWTTLIFYTLIWVFNPSNYMVAGLFLALTFVYMVILKDIRLSILITCLSSSIVFTGKTYSIQLVQQGILPTELYPSGLFTTFTISPNLIITIIMFFVLIRDILLKKIKVSRPNSQTIVVIIYFFWAIISDYFGSKAPSYSLMFSVFNLTLLVVYFYFKTYVKDNQKMFKYLTALFSALIIFESLISFQQLVSKSPIGKTIETQTNIESFGLAADELHFTYRPLGTFIHANYFGLWLSTYLMLFIYLALLEANRLSIFTLLIGFSALVTTLSRSSWIGFFIGAMATLYIIEKVRKIKLPKSFTKYLSVFILLAIPLFVVFILPRAQKSVYTFDEGGGFYREVQIRRGFELIAKYPIFGVGTERSIQEGLTLINKNDPNFSILFNVHNWFILTCVEHGIPSLLIFIVLISIIVNKIYRSGYTPRWKMFFVTGLLTNLVVGLFQPYINMQLIILTLAFL